MTTAEHVGGGEDDGLEVKLVADGWRGYAKAIAAAVTAGITYLMGIIPASGGFADVTTTGWLGFILAVVGAGGAVWAVPNRQRWQEINGEP